MVLFLSAFKSEICSNAWGVLIRPEDIHFDWIEVNGTTILAQFTFKGETLSDYDGKKSCEGCSAILCHDGKYYLLAENWSGTPALIHSCYKYEWVDRDGKKVRFPKWFEESLG